MNAKNLLLFALIVTLFSCNKQDKDEATINYYITTQKSDNFDHIQFKFEYIRAILNDGQKIKEVHLRPRMIEIDLKYPYEIYLGTSSMEAEKIEAYDIQISDVKVIKGTDTIALNQPEQYDDYASGSINPSKGDVVNVNLVLDVDASTIIGVAGGQNWINPQVAVE